MYNYSEEDYYGAANQAYGMDVGGSSYGKRPHSPDSVSPYKQSKMDDYSSTGYYSGITSAYSSDTTSSWPEPSPPGDNIDFSKDPFAVKGGIITPTSARGSTWGQRGQYSRRGEHRGRGGQVQRGGGQTQKWGTNIGGNKGQGRGGQNQGYSRGGQTQGQGRGGQNQGQGHGGQHQGQGRGGQGQRGSFNRGAMQQGRGQGRGRGAKNMGLPPNSFNQSAKRGKQGMGGRGGKVAPVHSMSKVIAVDTSQMSSAEKIRRFCLFLQNDTVKGNSIQTIENGLMSSKLGMRTEFEVEELTRISRKVMFTGRLCLDGVFLARGVGTQKKELKHEIFQKAYDILLTKTVAEIFNLVDPGADAIRQELETSLENQKADRVAIQQAVNMATERMVMSSDLRDTLTCIIQALQEPFKGLENPVSKIEQAITKSHCGVKHEYQCEEVRLRNGKPLFYGKLMFLDVVIARGNDVKKKTCKSKTYQAAIDALLTKPMESLLISVPPEVREEEQLEEGKPIDSRPNKRELPLEERFESLIKFVSGTMYRENNVSTIDLAAMQRGITPMAIYRQQGQGESATMTCEVYMENYLIATGVGQKRKETMQDAYSKAWDVLNTTTAEEIISQHKLLKTEETLDTNIVDIFVKGCGHSRESNIAGLKRFNKDGEMDDKNPEDIVIMEQASWVEDRVKHAFCILQHSATQNGMLLQWQVEHYGTCNEYKCTVYLQSKMLGQCVGPSKNIARNSACIDALFHLYETQDVVSIAKREDNTNWITWQTILNKAGVQQATIMVTGVPSGAVSTETKVETEAADPKVMEVLEKYVELFVKANNEPELSFGPGMPFVVQRELRVVARKFDVRMDVRQHNGETYCSLHSAMTPQQIVQRVKSNNGVFGRYKLVSKEYLPKHASVAPRLRRPQEEKESQEKMRLFKGPNSDMPPVEVQFEGMEAF